MTAKLIRSAKTFSIFHISEGLIEFSRDQYLVGYLGHSHFLTEFSAIAVRHFIILRGVDSLLSGDGWPGIDQPQSCIV
jgi:hypothetical protein